jgi:hypothetical protein
MKRISFSLLEDEFLFYWKSCSNGLKTFVGNVVFQSRAGYHCTWFLHGMDK